MLKRLKPQSQIPSIIALGIFVTCLGNQALATNKNCAGWPDPNACPKAASFADKADSATNWNKKHRALLAAAINYKACGDENNAIDTSSRANQLLEANTSKSTPNADSLMIQAMVDGVIQNGPACERSRKGGE